MFSFAAPGARRRMTLTPMIDLVFLILVFFMLASRFGSDAALPLRAGAGGYSGPPRLVEVGPRDLRLNGVRMDTRDLLTELVRLSDSGADTVVLRPDDDANLQRLIDVMTLMRDAGFENLAIVEARS